MYEWRAYPDLNINKYGKKSTVENTIIMKDNHV